MFGKAECLGMVPETWVLGHATRASNKQRGVPGVCTYPCQSISWVYSADVDGKNDCLVYVVVALLSTVHGERDAQRERKTPSMRHK
jgi:hypothetical protein